VQYKQTPTERLATSDPDWMASFLDSLAREVGFFPEVPL
jgi:hypothetical protein